MTGRTDWLRQQRQWFDLRQNPPTSPLRILFVTTSAGMGGIEHCAARLGAQFQARGYHVAHACRPGSTVEALCQDMGVPTHRLTVRNSGDLRAAWHLSHLIHAHSADIVHVHSRRDFVPAVAAVILARLAGGSPRLVLHAHLDKPLGTPERMAGFLFARTADSVIAVSDAVRRRLIAAHGFAPTFVRRVYNGVDAQDFRPPDSTRRRVRALWGVPGDARVIGMLGRLDAKGQDFVLDVAAPLLRRFPHLYLVMAGPDGHAGDTERLMERARTLGVGPRLILPGRCRDVTGAMAAFDVFAHLPSEEAFGQVLIEAMASGLATVATSVGGCPEVVQDGVNGLLVRPGDHKGLLHALSRLLSSPDTCAAMVDAGKQIAQEKFSQTDQINEIETVYRRITADRRLRQSDPIPHLHRGKRHLRETR